MDWFPLINSLRIAAVSTVVVFFVGVGAAQLIARLPRYAKALIDVVLLLLLVLGPRRVIGAWALQAFGVRLTMAWYSAIFACVVVAFPLMYRTARGAFEAYDKTLTHAALTLGRSRTWAFWRVQMPCCAQGVLAGAVLAFARALGEYGATAMICGYTPGQTATVSTTVYQLWRTGDDALALKWVLVNVAISAVVLLAMNWLEGRARTRGGRA